MYNRNYKRLVKLYKRIKREAVKIAIKDDLTPFYDVLQYNNRRKLVSLKKKLEKDNSKRLKKKEKVFK